MDQSWNLAYASELHKSRESLFLYELIVFLLVWKFRNVAKPIEHIRNVVYRYLAAAVLRYSLKEMSLNIFHSFKIGYHKTFMF